MDSGIMINTGLKEQAFATRKANFPDEIKFYAHQRNGKNPVDVAKFGWRRLVLRPEITHVEIVDSSNESNQPRNEQGILPFAFYPADLEKEKYSGGSHGHRADEEGKAYVITRLQLGQQHWLKVY